MLKRKVAFYQMGKLELLGNQIRTRLRSTSFRAFQLLLVSWWRKSNLPELRYKWKKEAKEDKTKVEMKMSEGKEFENFLKDALKSSRSRKNVKITPVQVKVKKRVLEKKIETNDFASLSDYFAEILKK